MTQKNGLRMLLVAGAAMACTAMMGQAQSAAAPSAPQPQVTTGQAAGGDAAGTAVPVAEIVARINDNIISKQDLDRSANELDEQAKEENWSPEQVERHRKLLLSDLIDQQLLEHEQRQQAGAPDRRDRDQRGPCPADLPAGQARQQRREQRQHRNRQQQRRIHLSPAAG